MTERRCHCEEGPAIIQMHSRWFLCIDCARKQGPLGLRAIARHEAGRDPGGFTPDVLKRIAAGPIMDSNEIFLPAGKISLQEAVARERASILPPEAA